MSDPNHTHVWLNPPARHFQRALGTYLRQNHGHRRSGKLTPRQRRRLWHKYPDEMRRRRYELTLYGPAAHKGWF